MDRQKIIIRLIEIDVIFDDNKNDEFFYKSDKADELRDEWAYLFNLLAIQ